MPLMRNAGYDINRSKGVLPFMLVQTIVMFLLVIFAQIVMWPLQMMTR